MHAISSALSSLPPHAGVAVPASLTREAAQAAQTAGHADGPSPPARQDDDLRHVFDAFVGETFFAQMLAAMRKTLGEPPYFHGGQGERVFQTQLDRLLAERLARSTGGQLSGKLYELFQLQRPGA